MIVLKKKTKQIIVLVLSIVAIIGSVSYALWNTTKKQNLTEEVNVGCFDVKFKEESSGINLKAAYPLTDEQGSNLEPYTLTITNICTTEVSYNVLVSLESDNTVDINNIKVKVNHKTPKVLGDSRTNDNGDYIIYTGTLEKSPNRSEEDNKSNTVDIRLWLKEDASEDIMREVFKAKVKIEATAGIIK